MAGLADNRLPKTKSRRSSRNPTPDENLMSSPTLPASESQVGGKPKKRPTVTPRTFTRFFTPRSSLGRGTRISAARQALRDITGTASNRKASDQQWTAAKNGLQVFEDTVIGFSGILRSRKRRTPVSPDTSPDRSSPLKRKRGRSRKHSEHGYGHDDKTDHEQELLNRLDDAEHHTSSANFQLLKPIARKTLAGPIGRVLRRELDISCSFRSTRAINYCSTSKSSYLSVYLPSLLMRPDWQSETTNFFSEPEDSYLCTNVDTAPTERALPFCTASCNSKLFPLRGMFHTRPC